MKAIDTLEDFLRILEEAKKEQKTTQSVNIQNIKERLNICLSFSDAECIQKYINTIQGEIEEAIGNIYENIITELKKEREKVTKIKEILDNLKINSIKTPCNVLGIEGESRTIILPKTENTEEFSFTLRKSNDVVNRQYLKDHPEFKKEGCDDEYICKILQAINKYLKELGIETDGDVDYLRWMNAYGSHKRKGGNEAGDCLKYLMDLGDSDTSYCVDGYWMNGEHNCCQEFLCCSGKMFQFQRIGNTRCKVLCKGK